VSRSPRCTSFASFKRNFTYSLFCIVHKIFFSISFRFYQQFFLFLFYLLFSLVCFTLRLGPPPKQIATTLAPLNSTGVNVTTPNPFGNSSAFTHISLQLRLTDISLAGPNSAPEHNLQYTVHAQTDSWPSHSVLALSTFFPLLLWSFLSSQLFCTHYSHWFLCAHSLFYVPKLL
jgi:hypothetical protein